MKIHDISISLAGVLFATVLGALGCGGGETHEFHNTGRACLFPGAGPVSNPLILPTTTIDYRADEVMTVSVLLRCLPSTCTVEGSVSASCTVELSGSTLRVDARGSFEDNGDDACSADCLPLQAQCVTAPIPASTLTFEYADQSAELVVPSSALPPCVEWAP